jgi:molybdopterin converting factor small subunit
LIAEPMKKINLKLYALVKDLLGTDKIDIDWIDNMTVGDLRKKLNESFPILSIINAQYTISINRRAVDDTKLIRKTDELALLPPISGG